MEASKILSVELIDVVFDGRNKAYGAYELRKTYSKRINRGLFITMTFVLLVCGGAIMANSSKKNKGRDKMGHEFIFTELPPEKKIEPKPKPEKPPEVKPPKTIMFTAPVIKEIVEFPPPDLGDLDSTRIGAKTIDGPPDDKVPKPEDLDDKKGIVQPKKEPEPDEPSGTVDIPAKFIGKWETFLLKNLKPETPVDNGAGAGRYTVVIQFVVDKEGNVSDIKALTNHGYGMEQEALRVIKKSPQWEPAIYNGYKVKAYHRQMITFDVLEE